ncbi:MAG: bifunctional riboflavin kinase/FAD synthetase [Acidimicrobiales bacterium]
MLIIRDSSTEVLDASVLTIGAFDGVHLGHQQVIAQVKERARARGVASAVVTFDTHPALVVRPESAPKLITTLERKFELLESFGVDVVYVIEFNTERASTTAADFVREVFVERLNVAEIVVGSDFHFGKAREGTVEVLTALGKEHDFVVDGLELLRQSDTPDHISSTAIRAAMADGRVRDANAMLGREYEIHGTIIGGDKRGRTIGFPTANMVLTEDMAWPANGVYAARYETPDGIVRPAAVNIGIRPTFYTTAEQALLEAHILDFDGDLYGSDARVRVVRRLRAERRFDGIEELRIQLERDVAEVRTVLADPC